MDKHLEMGVFLKLQVALRFWLIRGFEGGLVDKHLEMGVFLKLQVALKFWLP